MVQAAQAKADDEDHRQAQIAGQVGRVPPRPERHPEATDALDDEPIGSPGQRPDGAP